MGIKGLVVGGFVSESWSVKLSDLGALSPSRSRRREGPDGPVDHHSRSKRASGAGENGSGREDGFQRREGSIQSCSYARTTKSSIISSTFRPRHLKRALPCTT